MSGAGRCESCGAALIAAASACAWCGTKPAAEIRPAEPTEAELRAERFRRLKASPAFAAAMRDVTGAEIDDDFARHALFGAGVTGLSFLALSRHGRARGAAIVLPFFALAFLVRALIRGLGLAWTRPAPAVAAAARIAAKRTQFSGRRVAATDYFVTLEFEDGVRREYAAGSSWFGLVVEDDLGAAHFRDGRLAAFRKVAV